MRDEFWSLDRAAARARLGLPADAQVLLITGASLGARAINDATFTALPRLIAQAHVIHVTGSDDETRAMAARAALPEGVRERYHPHGFLDGMPAAMIAADLVVSRAGASTLGELPAAGAPAVLVPGEYEGWSQAPNAEYLQAEGAAVMLRNSELDQLADTVEALLRDDTRIARMREAARRLARPDAARDIARMLMEAA